MRQSKSVGFALCDMVLSTYGYTWDKFYPEFAGTKRVVWIPHSASPDFMRPYNGCPENSILLSGSMSDYYYPLRQQMLTLYVQGSYAISYHGHPGYYCGYDHETNEDIGRGYAEKINSLALLFADEGVTGPLKELGFVENSHYLPVSKENLEEKVQYILDERNHEELDEIRRRGQELVWERHKTSDRARQIDEACSAWSSGDEAQEMAFEWAAPLKSSWQWIR